MDPKHLEQKPEETVDQYRIRMLEVRMDEIVRTQMTIETLRRDLAIGILLVLVAMALISPAVWGVIVVAGGNAMQIIRGISG